MQGSATPGWQINLAWRQKVAAFWSISWAAWIATFSTGFAATAFLSNARFRENLFLISVSENVAFFLIQAILTRRLVSKDYRSFRVYVLRSDGHESRSLSLREGVQVWFWILGPQLAVLLTTSLIAWWYAARLPNQTIQSISSLSLWLRFLVVGPYAVDLAIRAQYVGFRLQAYGFRYV
jgi:hypothetical protein